MAKLDISKEAEVVRILLEKRSVNFGVTIPRHMINNMSIENWVEPLTDDLIIRFKTYLATQTSTETEKNVKKQKNFVEEVPLTWVDAFKLRFFPKYLLIKFPPKYRSIFYEYNSTINNITNIINMLPQVTINDINPQNSYFILEKYNFKNIDKTTEN